MEIHIKRRECPNVNIRAGYPGIRRYKVLIAQNISKTDGLILHVDGTEAERRHELTLYKQSGMGTVLEEALNIYG